MRAIAAKNPRKPSAGVLFGTQLRHLSMVAAMAKPFLQSSMSNKELRLLLLPCMLINGSHPITPSVDTGVALPRLR